MAVKLILVVVASALGALGMGAMSSPSLSSVGGGQENFRPGSLRGLAEKAKGEGKSQTTSAVGVEYAGTESPPEDFLSYAIILVAEAVDSHTHAPNDEDIVTWYRFRIVETLSEGVPCPRCPDRIPPAEVPAAGGGEFLLAKYGGTLTVDGVEVTKTEPGFPPFPLNEKYLLFVSKSPGGTVSLLAGPSGAYRVGPGGELSPVNRRPHPLKEMIARRFGGSVIRLKRRLGKS